MFGKDKKRGERCKDFIKTEDGRPQRENGKWQKCEAGRGDLRLSRYYGSVTYRLKTRVRGAVRLTCGPQGMNGSDPKGATACAS